MNKEKLYFAVFDYIMRLPANKYYLVLEKYKTFENAYNNISQEMLDFLNLKREYENCKKIYQKTNINKIQEYIEKLNINILFYDEFPLLLKNIADPPFALYTIGNINLLHCDCISVVGPRKTSTDAKHLIDKFVPTLVNNNFCIVSGMALGVDTLAHKSAIENNGKTIAVLGTGIDICYPYENKNLYEELKENHLLISEFYLGAISEKFHFPLRNRIIAGISKATLVIEAKKESGSLITAKLAFDYNREVFAIPGNILSHNFDGTNWLIKKQIARLVDDPNDILEQLNIIPNNLVKQVEINNIANLNEEEILIFKSLESPKDIDTLASEINISIDRLLHILSILEIKNHIKKIGDKWYR